jgi:hypothetical protein
VIQPDCLVDDLSRDAVTAVRIGRRAYAQDRATDGRLPPS